MPDLLHQLKALPALRHAKFQAIRRSGQPKKLIIGIGQVHAVLSGRFDGIQARRIADVQAWIADACGAIAETFGVRAFGEEGFNGTENAVFVGRLPDTLLASCREQCQAAGGPKPFLRQAATRWRKALARNDKREAEKAHAMLNGLTVLQALRPDAGVFPIEQRDVHGRIGAGLDALSGEIARIEATPAYRSVMAKRGKGLTPAEYETAVARGKLVEEFNALISHPDREMSILREVLEHAQDGLTVFILGIAHREPMLRLARENLPPDVGFVWITPPQLWRWKAMLRRAGVVLLLLLAAAAAVAYANA